MYTVPRFFYFLPLYAFLFGYFAVNSGKAKGGSEERQQVQFDAMDVLRRLNRLEQGAKTGQDSAVVIKGLNY